MPDYFWNGGNYGSPGVKKSLFNQWWEGANNSRLGSWVQDQYDNATRGAAQYGVHSWTDPYGGVGNYPENFNAVYWSDPETWNKKVLSDYGINLYGPFGEFAQKALLPNADTFYNLFTPDTTQGGIGGEAGAKMRYFDTFMGGDNQFQMDYSTIGEALSGAFSGDSNSLFAKHLLEADAKPDQQLQMIGQGIQAIAMGTGAMSSSQLAVVSDELQYQFDHYKMAQANGNVSMNQSFREFLVNNAADFLDYYWSKERWTAAAPRNPSNTGGVNAGTAP